MMWPGAGFLSVTMGVVGTVTWGPNIALCCWGWRTCDGFKCRLCATTVMCTLYVLLCNFRKWKYLWCFVFYINATQCYWCELKFEILINQFTSEEVCPGLLTPDWSSGLLTGTVRQGAGLPRTTVLEVGEVEETGAEAGWGSWLCWIKAAESGVSCLKAGRLL